MDSTDGSETRRDRRSFLRWAGAASMVGLAGCGGGDGGGPATTTTTPADTTDLSGPVPQEYLDAESQAGIARQISLLPKSSVSYQQSPNGDKKCANCKFYIPDKNGDGIGACARVEGLIIPNGWCSEYERNEG